MKRETKEKGIKGVEKENNGKKTEKGKINGKKTIYIYIYICIIYWM